MPLFVKEDRAVLYVHVPKTGGTAIEAFFLKNGFRAEFFDTGGPQSFNKYRRCAPQHMDARQIQALLRPGKIDYVFMTVRDPVARIVSEYKMQSRTLGGCGLMGDWLERMLAQYAKSPYFFENHFRPQVEFRIGECDFFRQEEGYGEALVERIEQRTGLRIRNRKIDVHNTDTQTVVDVAQAEAIGPRVRDFYAQDCRMFGY
jgi:hypothetical protein